MSECELFWLMDFPLIDSWAHLERTAIFLLKRHTLIIKISNYTVDGDHKLLLLNINSSCKMVWPLKAKKVVKSKVAAKK